MFKSAITAYFGGDTSDLQKSATSAEGIVSRTADRIGNIFKAVAATISAGALVGMFKSLGGQAIELAGKLSDTAANLGINVEALQALQAQHALNGVSQDQFTAALTKAKAAVIDAAGGNRQAAEALAKLGLSAGDLIRLPLEQQYEAIARGAASAHDKNQAFAAVSTIMGERVGPQLMASLQELAREGLPAVVSSATEAGKVMSQETVAGLDRAGDAIDDFKRRAVVAVGNILVNFDSVEGLKLLGLKLMKAAGEFGGMILDALSGANSMIGAVFTGTFRGLVNMFQDGLVEAVKKVAAGVNILLPQNFEINIANLDQFKSNGRSVADEITYALSQTSPTTFKKDFGEAWQRAVDDQQKVVDALRKTDLAPAADQLAAGGKAAGENVAAGGKAAGDAISGAADDVKAAGDDAANAISSALKDTSPPKPVGRTTPAEVKDAADQLIKAQQEFDDAKTVLTGDAASQERYAAAESRLANAKHAAAVAVASGSQWQGLSTSINRTGTPYEDQSTASLRGVLGRINKQYYDIKSDFPFADINGPGPEYGAAVALGAFQVEINRIKAELGRRESVAEYAARNGEAAARRAFGDAVTDRGLRETQEDSKRATVALETLVAGLRARGILKG